jgi:translation initiation factor 3 subunit A
MAPFSKPEAVLKQAEGLVSVGQTHAALQSLTEMLTSKRVRSTPLPALEPVLLRFVELCVDMRKGRTAKEGLMQYKNIAQNTNVASIDVVIQKFLSLADAKVQEAQEKADKAVALDVDDLEASETPESILLGAVSGDQSKDRTDRALVTPWLKFLWESYRTSLETLKNNARLETIYQQVAQQAFRFCLKHQRKVEFRRLCETLRLHLSNVAKYSHQTHSINLSDPEILQHHLDTRFAQLNTSVELELWQEAFRSVEDVHNLLTMAKKAPRPSMMANYYEKLTKIFRMSGNSLYHAAAWGRYYAVVTTIGGKSDEEMSRLAGQVLISALAVPVGQRSDEDDGKSKTTRLAALLGLTKAPTRAGLLKDALSRDVLRLSPTPIKTLYNLLEASFDPLNLCASSAPILTTLCAEDTPYAGYRPLLARALLSRLLAQLAQVYSTLKISALIEFVKPLEEFGAEQVEAYLMGCARRAELRVRVDHATETISFIDDAFAHPDESCAVAGPSSASTSRDTTLQPSNADLVRTRLSTLATALHNAVRVIDPPADQEASLQASKFAELVAAANAERRALSLRKALVARRRELLSELSVRKEKEEASRRAELSRTKKLIDEQKEKDDAKKKELERARKEIESIRTEEAKKLAQDLMKRGGLKVSIADMEDLSKDSLMRLQVEQLEKEKKDLNERLRIASKRIDHIERAYRKDERPLLDQDYLEQQATDRITFDALRKARIENSLAAHNEAVASKKRLSRMVADFRKHKETLLSTRSEEFTKKRAAAEKKIKEEKDARREAHANQIAEERRKLEDAEEAARKAEEDRLRLESERQAEEEAAAAKKREEEEQQAEQRRQRELERAAAAEEARMKAQREAEAEERAAARRRGLLKPEAPPAAPEGAWRKSAPIAPPLRSAAPATPPRTQSPAPSPAVASGPPRLRPNVPAAAGGWRQRAADKEAGIAPSPRPESPAVAHAPLPEAKKDVDGFEPVSDKKWRPKRLQGRP